MHHWVVLAERNGSWPQCMSNDRSAWVADIELMLDGCREFWTYNLLHTISLFGVLDRSTDWDGRLADRWVIAK